MRKRIAIWMFVFSLTLCACYNETFYLTDEQKMWFGPFDDSLQLMYASNSGRTVVVAVENDGATLKCTRYHHDFWGNALNCRDNTNYEQHWEIRLEPETQYAPSDSIFPFITLFAHSYEKEEYFDGVKTHGLYETYIYDFWNHCDIMAAHTVRDDVHLLNKTYSGVHVVVPNIYSTSATADSFYLSPVHGFIGIKKKNGIVWELQ